MKAILAEQSMAVMMIAVMALIGARSVYAQNTYNWNGSGNWDADARWGGNQPYANAGDIGEVDSGTCITTTTTFKGQLNINPGGTLQTLKGISTTADNLHLRGGRINFQQGSSTASLDGNIYVDADSRLDSSGDSLLYIDATLQGSNNLERVRSAGTGSNVISFDGDNQAFSGNWIVTDGTLQFTSNNAAGTGDILVNGGMLSMDAVTITNKITIMPGASLNPVKADKGTVDLENLIMNGGRIMKESSSSHPIVAGHLTLTDHSSFEFASGGGFITISADIIGSYSITHRTDFIKYDSGTYIIAGDNLAFSGDWLIESGIIEFNSTNSFGTGSVTVDAGAEFKLNDDRDWTLSTDFGGGGTLSVGTGTNIGGLHRTLTLMGSRITTENIDGTPGILKIWNAYHNNQNKAHVDLVADGSKLCELVISVAGAGDTPGEDHGQLSLIRDTHAGDLTGLENCDLVVDSTSLVNAAEFDMENVLTIVECGNDLTGMAFNSVTFEGPLKAKSISYNNGSITLGDWVPSLQPLMIIIR